MTNHEKLNRHIAEVVHKWHVRQKDLDNKMRVVQYFDEDGKPTGRYLSHVSSPAQQMLIHDPYHNDTQARQALEVWEECSICRTGGLYHVTILKVLPAGTVPSSVIAHNKSFSAAIVEALCQATGYKEETE